MKKKKKKSLDKIQKLSLRRQHKTAETKRMMRVTQMLEKWTDFCRLLGTGKRLNFQDLCWWKAVLGKREGSRACGRDLGGFMHAAGFVLSWILRLRGVGGKKTYVRVLWGKKKSSRVFMFKSLHRVRRWSLQSELTMGRWYNECTRLLGENCGRLHLK